MAYDSRAEKFYGKYLDSGCYTFYCRGCNLWYDSRLGHRCRVDSKYHEKPRIIFDNEVFIMLQGIFDCSYERAKEIVEILPKIPEEDLLLIFGGEKL